MSGGEGREEENWLQELKMTLFCFARLLDLADKQKREETIAESYLLMLLPSFSLSPAAPVFVALSLPAKSTRLSLPTFSPDVCKRNQRTAAVSSLKLHSSRYFQTGVKLHVL